MLEDTSTVELVRSTLTLALKIAFPVLAAGVVIGLVISLAQSITSLQDQTLSIVPKIFGMIVVSVLLLSWMVRQLIEFSAAMFTLG